MAWRFPTGAGRRRPIGQRPGRWARLFALGAVAWFSLLSPARAQPRPPVVDLTLGTSTEGRPITALRVGAGALKFVLVGAAHGAPERNTFDLVTELAAHFRANPGAVPADVRLYIIPSLNPDGLALGLRQNGNGVDLNRNMDTRADSCAENDWSQRVEGAYGIVSDTGGPYSESEVESRLIRDFLLDASGVIFFHTSGGVVFPACKHPPSDALGQAFARGSGYEFIPEWDLYTITGGMHDWAGGLGIPAITPELITADQPETSANLAGVMAVLQDARALLPVPEPRFEAGVEVQPVIWRGWKAWGGEQLFGLPLGPASPIDGGWQQLFERGVFEYRPGQSDTASVVQLAPLGAGLLGSASAGPEPPGAGERFFPETGQHLGGLFAEFWQVNGGERMFGLPLSPETTGLGQGSAPVVRQVFERVVLDRAPGAVDATDVSLAPIGRVQWAQRDARTPQSRLAAR